jgi:hypothetical protein
MWIAEVCYTKYANASSTVMGVTTRSSDGSRLCKKIFLSAHRITQLPLQSTYIHHRSSPRSSFAFSIRTLVLFKICNISLYVRFFSLPKQTVQRLLKRTKSKSSLFKRAVGIRDAHDCVFYPCQKAQY